MRRVSKSAFGQLWQRDRIFLERVVKADDPQVERKSDCQCQHEDTVKKLWIRHQSRQWLRAVSFLSVSLTGICGSMTDSLAGEVPWGLRPGLIRPANSADQPVLELPEVPELGDENAPNIPPLELNPLRPAAWQNQYPLSKDADDLLPREEPFHDKWEAPPRKLFHDDEDNDPSERSDTPWLEWKKTTNTLTWIAPGSDGMGVTTLDIRGSLELPDCPAIWFVPRVGVSWLNGPQVTDLPGQLWDFSFEGVAAMPLGDRWILQAAVAPSFYTDGDNTSSDAFRLPARLLAFWKYSDRLTVAGGVFFLDRDDVNWLPVAGLLWNPNDDWKVELMAPRPRVAWRCSRGEEADRWLYVVGEFGGGTWAVRRNSGQDDAATVSDYRAMLGYEQKSPRGTGWWVEAGVVFKRQLKFQSSLTEFDLADTLLVRAGMAF